MCDSRRIVSTSESSDMEDQGQSMPSLVVAIVTYRRPEQLRTNMQAIVAHISAISAEPLGLSSITILVVDNDAEQSAREIVAGLPTVRYVCEPTPGIATARNRALDESAVADLLVFIDDDERPRAGWLTRLVEMWQHSKAAAVAGHVVPDYQTPPDPWILAGNFFERPVRETGSTMTAFATNNLLLDLRQLRSVGLRFEEPFGATGGEDSLLGMRIARAGRTIVWCAESVVEDRVPADRLTRSWVLQRAFSHGNNHALIDCYLATGLIGNTAARARRATAGLVYIARGAGRYLTGQAARSIIRQATGLRLLYRGLGMLAGLTGHAYQQYARESTSDN